MSDLSGYIIYDYAGIPYNNVDLSGLFNPYVSGTTASATNYYRIVNSTMKDLNILFAPYTTSKLTFDTGYKVNGLDLRHIFEKKPIFTVTGGSFVQGTFTSGSNTYYYITVSYNATNTVIKFNEALTSSNNYTSISGNDLTVICIASGGSGGGGSVDYRPATSQNTWSSGGGGGGGGIVYAKTSVNANDYYRISASANGAGGGGGNPGIKGGDSYVIKNADTSNNAFIKCYGGDSGKGWGAGGGGGLGGTFLCTESASTYIGSDGGDAGRGCRIWTTENASLNRTNLAATAGSGSSVTLSIPSNSPANAFMYTQYSGGGGGGGGTRTVSGNGGGGGNGRSGGVVGGSTVRNGQAGIYPGSGGGGGGITSGTTSMGSNGGVGGNGRVIIYFRYP
jgi:hypothetical protein